VLSLEQALEFCREDECVEVTPGFVRIRKVQLNMQDREKTRSKSRSRG
jgi:GTP-binding protein